LSDEEGECKRCSTPFTVSREVRVLIALFSWQLPTSCIRGCDEKARRNLRGDRLKLAKLQERLDIAASTPLKTATGDGTPSKPEDLFKGLDALVEKAAAEEAAAVAVQNQPEGDSKGGSGLFGLRARDGEDLPSPDSLFKELAGPSRKSSLD